LEVSEQKKTKKNASTKKASTAQPTIPNSGAGQTASTSTEKTSAEQVDINSKDKGKQTASTSTEIALNDSEGITEPAANEQRVQGPDDYSPADSSSVKLTKSSLEIDTTTATTLVNISSDSDNEPNEETLEESADEVEETRFPAQFNNMNNEFEIALWVAQHLRILNLAKEIQNAKSTPITSTKESSQVLSALLYPTSIITSPEIDQVIYCILNVILTYLLLINTFKFSIKNSSYKTSARRFFSELETILKNYMKN